MTYEFTTKAEYLTAKAQWKVDFKAHITHVRASKRRIRDANREYSTDARKIDGIWSAYVDLGRAHDETNRLLVVRSSMRVEAQRQYLALQCVDK